VTGDSCVNSENGPGGGQLKLAWHKHPGKGPPQNDRFEPFLAGCIPQSRMLGVDIEEQKLAPAAREGDARAWDLLFRRYQLPLYAYVHQMVQNEHDAIEIVQETFVNAFRHIQSLREDAKFGSWLFGIAHQKTIQHWRRTAKRKDLLELDSDDSAELPEETDDPGDCLIRKEDETRFYQLLASLPHIHRAVLVLHFLEDFSLEQIADIAGIPVGTVKSRLYHAKRALRKLLEN
jgi:RNA polymerase sigma-70 factor, ECF subfamily